MNKECKSCNTINIEGHWLMVKDNWVCLYCYNGTYSLKKQLKIRKDKQIK